MDRQRLVLIATHFHHFKPKKVQMFVKFAQAEIFLYLLVSFNVQNLAMARIIVLLLLLHFIFKGTQDQLLKSCLR